MKFVASIGILLLLPAAVFAQNIFPAKDLAFAQIAAGGGYETVLNVTNRSTVTYQGSLTLIPSDRTKPFSLLVNGNPLTGILNLPVDPGATVSLRITNADASLITTGFATITSADRTQAGVLEGNLTYYVKSTSGTSLDSVGVAPSNEVFQAVIPFDDFSTVALALANLNGGQPATVQLTLFDDKNSQKGAPLTQPLVGNQQLAKFLREYFGNQPITKGRVEIQSDHLIIGTALTFVAGGQASSLPFLPAVKIYNYTVSAIGNTLTGQFYILINGPHVTGYEHSVATNGVASQSGLDSMTGNFINGNLELMIHGGRGTSTELISYGLITNYDPTKTTQTGSVVIYFVNPPGVAAQGTATITAIN